jgi:flagellar hook protein FlgE
MDWIINTAQGTAPNFLITQVAAASGTTNSKQNGYGAGVMQGLTVDTNGRIIGTFTNGQTYPVGQVAMSIFTNNNGLQKVGQNIWKETVASGPASIGVANDVGRGSILGAHYEMSNVDVADEFTRLIITQRGYQANSRIVTTSDEMMVETLNLKR